MGKVQQKVVITGAGGFLGKYLASYLASQGDKVYALTLYDPSDDDKKMFFSSENIVLVKKDIAKDGFDDLPNDIDVVIALAQSPFFREFPDKAKDIFDVNVAAFAQILQWANRIKVKKFVYASSGGVYNDPLAKEYKEDDVINPNISKGYYQGSKLCGEILFQNYYSFFETSIILRPFFIYGKTQNKDMFVARIIDSVLNGKEIFLQGKEGLLVNPVYVEDVVKVIVKALELTNNHIINVGGPDVISLKEIAEVISKRVQKAPVYKYVDAPPTDCVGNIDKLKKLFDIELTSFAKGIDLTVDTI